MSERLVTVFAGPFWEASVLQGRLEQEGIPACLPDQMIKTMDPFITGSNAFEVSLHVPASFAERALEITASWQKVSREEPEEVSLQEELRRLSRRARWASLWVVTAPYALYLVCRYVSITRRYGLRPRDYPYTIMAVFMSLAALATALAYAFTPA